MTKTVEFEFDIRDKVYRVCLGSNCITHAVISRQYYDNGVIYYGTGQHEARLPEEFLYLSPVAALNYYLSTFKKELAINSCEQIKKLCQE